jgi:hypothetical protein
VVIRGHPLEPIFLAIEEQTLMRIRAQPELAEDLSRETDTFATDIQFLRTAIKGGKKNGQAELDLE